MGTEEVRTPRLRALSFRNLVEAREGHWEGEYEALVGPWRVSS